MNRSFIALVASLSLYLLGNYTNAQPAVEGLNLSEGAADGYSPYSFCAAFPDSPTCYGQSYYDLDFYYPSYGYYSGYGDYGYSRYNYHRGRRHHDGRNSHNDRHRNRDRMSGGGWKHGRNR